MKTGRAAVLLLYICLLSTALHGQIGNDETFVRVVDHLPHGYVRDASVDYTGILQQIVNKYPRIIFPGFPILINDRGINILSGRCLKFEPGGSLVLKPNDKTHYAMLNIEDAEDVQILNAKLIGDRPRHKGSKGEWGMGIYIKGGKNIHIEGVSIADVWGDGIDIYKSSKQNSQNITIEKTEIKKARRNGITIGSGSDISIDNCVVQEINGTLPMAGICIEPNNNKDELGKIRISNVATSNCKTGLHLGLSRYPSDTSRIVDIAINDFRSYRDDYGILVGDYKRGYQYGPAIKKLSGKISLSDITISDAKQEPIKYYSQYGYGYAPRILFKDVRISGRNKMTANQIKRNLKIRNFNVDEF